MAPGDARAKRLFIHERADEEHAEWMGIAAKKLTDSPVPEEVPHRKRIPQRMNAAPAEAPIWQQIPDVQVSDTSHILCITLSPNKLCLILSCI